MPPLLEVDRVSKSFGGVAANVEISFTVAEGELLGLIGPNGAGKTSLFNSISGEVSPDRGEIRLDGRRISGAGPLACARAGIARTFQVVRSFDSMTVLENVMVGAFSRTNRARDAMAEAERVLGLTGLAARADRPAHALTPPEKRRLEIARALATRPRILLLDEMLTGLTPTEAQSGVQLIRDIRDTGRHHHHGRARDGDPAPADRPRRGAEPRPRPHAGPARGPGARPGRHPRLSRRPLCRLSPS